MSLEIGGVSVAVCLKQCGSLAQSRAPLGRQGWERLPGFLGEGDTRVGA